MIGSENSENKEEPAPPQAPKVHKYVIGGMNVRMQRDANENDYRVTAGESSSSNTERVLKIISDALSEVCEFNASIPRRQENVNVFGSDMTLGFYEPKPMLNGEILQSTLQSLSERYKTLEDLLVYERNVRTHDAARDKSAAHTVAIAKTKPYLAAVIKYMENQGNPLTEKDIGALRALFSEVYRWELVNDDCTSGRGRC